MPLRPVTFFLPSSSSIQVYFSDILSDELSVQNFEIKSLTGTSGDLTVKSIDVVDNYVKITTNPQNARTYYVLNLKHSKEFPFSSKSGDTLINDKVSRSIYFVAAQEYNPIRDRIFASLPKMYNLEGTLIEDIISSQAKELHNAQRSVGELLSDNYIRVPINDEIRTRGGTSLDKLANENCFKIKRVSLEPTGNVPKTKTVEYNDRQEYPRHDIIENIISLQEDIIEEEIVISKENRYSDGLILNLDKNIIKLLSLTLVDELGNETEYNINSFSYLINDNRYDKLAKILTTLEQNQLLIPPLTNISNNNFGDKVRITYLTKDRTISTLDFFEATELILNFREAIPTNTNNFFLSNFNIVNTNGDTPSLGGLTIRANQSETEPPFIFSNEIKYEIRVPSNPGEYSVNYETGEVLIYGLDGSGVGEESYYVEYNYKRILRENFDYYIYQNEFVLNKSRSVLNNKISLNYDTENVFVEGEDYLDKTHVEVLNEEVKNNISTSFSILTRNSPVAQIFRIFNRTTGEIYNPLYAIDNKVFFSGNRSPEIKTLDSQQVLFRKNYREEMFSSIVAINPAFVRTIKTASNPSNITITPGIPAHLIDTSSEDYYIKDINTGQDFQINYFGSGAVINSVAIKGSTLPSPGAQIHIGTKLAVIDLKQNGITSLSNGIGSVLSSSVSFDSDYFSTEKYFEESDNLSINSNFDISIVTSLSSENIFSNLQRLRKTGDYAIDYKNGVVYLAAPSETIESFGYVDYSDKTMDNTTFNLLTVNDVKYVNSKTKTNYILENSEIKDDKIDIIELPSHFEKNDGSLAFFGSDEFETNILLDSYEIITSKDILNLNGLYTADSVLGVDIDNPAGPTVSEITSDNKDDKNLINQRSFYIDQNKIDLKYNEYFYPSANGSNLEIIINNPSANIIEIISVKTGKKVCGQDLINRKEEVFYTNINQSFGSFTVSVIDSDVFSNIKTGGFLSNESGSSYPISSYSAISKTITCTGTFDGESLYLSTQGSQIQTATETTIIFDVNSDLEEGFQFLVKYIDDEIPAIGTAFFTDYSSGVLEADYSYVHDNIEISYEYGDNGLDWSKSNSLKEGDNYFVSYEFGALRGALERNFANLVQLPYFQNFSLNKDREVFRDALEGALNSFSEGPLISSIESLVESITKTKPEVIEKFFGNWILGRSHLSENRIKYEGDLQYEPVKYDTGLYFKKDTSVVAPAESAVRLDSGSVSMFFKNKWDGFENDAPIKVFLDDFGKTIFKYNTDYNFKHPENNISLLNFMNYKGILTNPNVLRFSNHKYNDTTESYEFSHFGFAKKVKNVNTLDKIDYSVKNKINILNIDSVNTKNGLIISQMMFNDGTKTSVIENKIQNLGSFTETVTVPGISSFELERKELTTKIIGSSSEFFNIFTKKINVRFSSPLDISSILSANKIGHKNVTIENVFVYNSGYIYKINSFVSHGIKTQTASSNVEEINIDFIPLNFDGSQTYDDLNALNFSNIFELICIKSEVKLSTLDYTLLGNNNDSFLVNFNNFSEFYVHSDSSKNEFSVNVDDYKIDFLWSDLYLTKDFKNYAISTYPMSNDDATEITKHRGFLSLTTNTTDRIDSYTKDMQIRIDRYLDQEKIYIGLRGYNPKSVNFELSNLSKDIEGLKDVSDDGFYIGIVDFKPEGEKETRKVWKVITRINNIKKLPYSVAYFNGETTTTYYSYNLNIDFSGKIIVDGDVNLLTKLQLLKEPEYDIS